MDRDLLIEKKSWHARLFFWSLRVWLRFKYGDGWKYDKQLHRHSRSTNLCFYVRTMAVWMPLVLALHLALVVWILYVAFVLPAHLFSIVSTAKLYELFVISLAGSWAIFWSVNWFWDNKLEPKIEQRRQTAKVRKRAKALESKTGLSASEVLVEWVKARKRDICPFITFKKEEGVQE